jgi:Pyruvate/2-oxoacid:ferredoxin oxidoreductase delta subunit
MRQIVSAFRIFPNRFKSLSWAFTSAISQSSTILKKERKRQTSPLPACQRFVILWMDQNDASRMFTLGGNTMKRLFLRRSTAEFYGESRRTTGVSFFDWLHGYVYTRWPYLYIGLATGRHPAIRYLHPLMDWFDKRITRRPRDKKSSGTAVSFADTYHGKVVPLAQAEKLVQVNRDVRLENLEQIIPYRKAKDIVLKNPDHIVLLDCPCRLTKPDHCEPVDVCLIIGEPFAGFVAEHHPAKSRRISRDEALLVLREEHARGHVHHAFFKDAMLGRFYAICNCCSCCCGAMQAFSHGVPMLAHSGFSPRVDLSKCVRCDTCIASCPFSAIEKVDGKIRISNRCMGCGVCVTHCQGKAITLGPDPAKGVPLDIRALMEMPESERSVTA